MSTARILARNIFSNWAGLAVSIGIGFFMMPFLVHRLGDTIYGVWTLVVSLVGYGNLLDFGVRTAVVKFVSQHLAVDDRERLCGLFSTTLALYSVIGIIVLALAALTASFLPYLFHIPHEIAEEAQLTVIIVGISLALKFPGSVFDGFLSGLQRYDVTNAIMILFSLIRAFLIVFLVTEGGRLLALAAAMLFCDVLTVVLTAFICMRLLPWLSVGRRHLNRAFVKDVYIFGLWSSLIMVSGRVIHDSDSIFIGMFFPAAAITHFAVASALVRYLRQLAYGFGGVFTPAASDLEARDDRERLRRLVIFGTRYALTVVLGAAMSIAVFGGEFLSLWMGAEYATESGKVLLVLVVSQAAYIGQAPTVSVLFGLNRHRQLAFLHLGEAFVKVALSLMLLPSLGILGAAVGTAIPQLAASVVLVAIGARLAAVSPGRYLREALFAPTACALVTGALVFVMRTVFPPISWSLFVLEVLAALVFYAVMAFRFCIDAPRRSMVVTFLTTMFRRPAV